MAKPIKETPVLKGRDAVRFLKNMKAPKAVISPEVMKRMKENYERLKAAEQF